MTIEDDTEARIAALEDQVRMLVVASTLDDVHEPYTAELLRRNVNGARLAALNLVLSAAFERARGQQPRRPRAFPLANADLDQIYEPVPITREEAIALIGNVLKVAPSVAELLLVAHKRSGLGVSGHNALGT